MANTRASRVPEWTIKPMRRRAVRLCDWCFRSNRRCLDSRRRGYKPSDSWKNHRHDQWRAKGIDGLGNGESAGSVGVTGKGTGAER